MTAASFAYEVDDGVAVDHARHRRCRDRSHGCALRGRVGSGRHPPRHGGRRRAGVALRGGQPRPRRPDRRARRRPAIAEFSPADDSFVTSTQTGELIIWDAATGAELQRISGHEGRSSPRPTTRPATSSSRPAATTSCASGTCSTELKSRPCRASSRPGRRPGSASTRAIPIDSWSRRRSVPA